MDSVKRAIEALRQAEASLREIVTKAATTGDYGSVVKIASWASAMSALLKEAGVGNGAQSPVPNQKKSHFQAGNSQSQATPRRTKHSVADEYPQFFRNEDQLIRVAWSKKEKTEYQHKVPSPVLKLLAKAMAKAGTDGRIFSTDQFLPIHDADGEKIPSYQAYVGIALMKHAGLLDQHGRQGYSIPRLEEFQNAVESVWQKVPKQ